MTRVRPRLRKAPGARAAGAVRHLDVAKLRAQRGVVDVKTGHLRNHLSRYLQHVRRTGETIVVLDRAVPVAEIRPWSGEARGTPSDVWGSRARFETLAGAWEDFDLPDCRTHARKQRSPLD